MKFSSSSLFVFSLSLSLLQQSTLIASIILPQPSVPPHRSEVESHVLPATSAGSLNRWPGFSPAGYSGVCVNNWFGGKWRVSVTTGSLCLLSAGVM